MSNQQLRSVAGAEPKAKEAKTFPALLDAFKGEIARALPKHLNADRMCRIALTCFRQNPGLADCEPKSVFAAVILGAQLGLEPGIGGQSYLIPYKDRRKGTTTCQFIPGWQGLVDLVSRAGRASVWTGAVYAGDEFDYALGDRPFVKHKPNADEENVDALRYVYAVGRVKDAEWPVVEVWPMNKVRKHLARYNKVGDRHYAHENMEMYGRKVALLQVLKYMPKSVEVLTGMSLANSENEPQNINLSDAINNTYTPAIEGESTHVDDAGNESTDTTTGEITGVDKPHAGLTFAALAERFNKATDVDVLDADATLLKEIEDEAQRAELTKIYKDKRASLT